jgi:heavy metal sensor kinase
MSLATPKGRPGLTLRARLVASTIVAVAIALAVGFIWARRNLNQVLVEQLDETLAIKHQELSAVAAGSLEMLDRELHREIEVYERVAMTVRIDLGDRVLVAPDDRDGRRIAAHLKSASSGKGTQTIPAVDEIPTLRVMSGRFSVAGRELGDISIALSQEPAYETLRLFDRRVLLGGLTLLIIAVPVGLWLYRQALRPVTKAVRAARRLDPSDLSARLPSSGLGDELDQLSQVINELLAKLERHHQRVTTFTADASHELRTPLAAMRTSIDVALQRPRDVNEYRTALEALGDQCDRLTAVVEKLQLLARADAGRLQAKAEPVDLSQLVRETVDFLAPLAEEHGLTIECKAESGVVVGGDHAYLRQVMVNLIDNAIKFTPHGGSIVVSVAADADRAAITVADSGAGIREAELEQLFERFYRSNSARMHKGSGLGLSICRSIVESHGGAISAASRPGEGSVFTISLPRSLRTINDKSFP